MSEGQGVPDMPRRDLFIDEKGLEFTLRCPHWRKGNKHLVESMTVGKGSKTWDGWGWGCLASIVIL